MADSEYAPKQGQKPDIFDFQDYRAFLRALFAHAKRRRQAPTRKAVAVELGISLSGLSMILAGERKLNSVHLSPLGRAIGLSSSEQKYFEALVLKGQAGSAEAVVESVRRMNEIKKYRQSNPREAEVSRYLTHWYYVAIREMAGLPDFVLNAKWIKHRLSVPVPLQEIQRAVDFLLEHGYIERKSDGNTVPPNKTLECMDGIYKIALGQFHREVLDLASRAIAECPSEERNLVGFTFSCSEQGFRRALEILERAHSEIQSLAQSSADGKSDSVYHAEFCLFPLVRKEGRGL